LAAIHKLKIRELIKSWRCFVGEKCRFYLWKWCFHCGPSY